MLNQEQVCRCVSLSRRRQYACSCLGLEQETCNQVANQVAILQQCLNADCLRFRELGVSPHSLASQGSSSTTLLLFEFSNLLGGSSLSSRKITAITEQSCLSLPQRTCNQLQWQEASGVRTNFGMASSSRPAEKLWHRTDGIILLCV